MALVVARRLSPILSHHLSPPADISRFLPPSRHCNRDTFEKEKRNRWDSIWPALVAIGTEPTDRVTVGLVVAVVALPVATDSVPQPAHTEGFRRRASEVVVAAAAAVQSAQKHCPVAAHSFQRSYCFVEVAVLSQTDWSRVAVDLMLRTNPAAAAEAGYSQTDLVESELQ